jgi:hypothetical protein
MSRHVGVIDLGNADASSGLDQARAIEDALGTPFARVSKTVASPAARAARPRERWVAFPRFTALNRWPGVTRTLSLFFPGMGHILRGEAELGVFLLTAMLFLASVGWAILETLDRLAGTLSLLGYPVVTAFWTLGLLYATGALIHLACVLSSVRPVDPADEIDYHPVVPGVASAIVPGWGQLINGDRIRAGLFVASVWIAGAVWIAVSQPATDLLNTYLPAVSTWEQAARGPGLLWAAQWTFPAVVWALAVYDSAATAASRR